MKFRVVIEQDEDGVVSQGPTRSEARDNIRDAIQGYLESLKAHNEPIPPPISEEMVKISSDQ